MTVRAFHVPSYLTSVLSRQRQKVEEAVGKDRLHGKLSVLNPFSGVTGPFFPVILNAAERSEESGMLHRKPGMRYRSEGLQVSALDSSSLRSSE